MSLGRKCHYATCGIYSIQAPDKSFHSFPTSKQNREIWIKNAGVKGVTNDQPLYLCSDHFDENSFMDEDRRELKLNAVPIECGKLQKSYEHPNFHSAMLAHFSMHPCRNCGAVFTSAANAVAHEKMCDRLGLYECDNCGLKFILNRLFKRHVAKCKLSNQPKECIVFGCKSNNSECLTSEGEVITFPLPFNKDLRTAWLDVTPISSVLPISVESNYHICIKHFAEEDIITNSDKSATLKPTAVPCIFNVIICQTKEFDKCFIPGCNSNKNQDKEKLNIPTFRPSLYNVKQKDDWKGIIMTKYKQQFSAAHVICLLHFKEDDYFLDSEQTFLKHGVVPSVFPTFLPPNDNGKTNNASDSDLAVPVPVFLNGKRVLLFVSPETNDFIAKRKLLDKQILTPDTDSKKEKSVCCVPGCPTIPKPGVGFHTFPMKGETRVEIIDMKAKSDSSWKLGKIVDLCSIWMERVCLTEIKSSTLICTKHFTEKDYILDVGPPITKKLIKLAVPSQNLPVTCLPCILLPYDPKRRKIGPRPPAIKQKDTDSGSEELSDGYEDGDYEMTKPCSISTCNSHTLQMPMRTLHSLPKNLKRAQEWAEVCGYPQWLDNGLTHARKNIRLCSLHFSPLRFRGTQMKRLRNGSMPTITDPLALPGPEQNEAETPNSDTKQKTETPNSDTKQSSYVKCAVNFCENYFDESKPEFLGQNYFSFPSDPELRLAWIRAIGKPDNWNPSKSRICSQHFNKSDLMNDTLRPLSLPTLYLLAVKVRSKPITPLIPPTSSVPREKLNQQPPVNGLTNTGLPNLPSEYLSKPSQSKVLQFNGEVVTRPRGRPRKDLLRKHVKTGRPRGRPRIHTAKKPPKVSTGRPRGRPRKYPPKDDIPMDSSEVQTSTLESNSNHEMLNISLKSETSTYIEENEKNISEINETSEEAEVSEDELREASQLVIVKTERIDAFEFENAEQDIEFGEEEELCPPFKKIKLEKIHSYNEFEPGITDECSNNGQSNEPYLNVVVKSEMITKDKEDEGATKKQALEEGEAEKGVVDVEGEAGKDKDDEVEKEVDESQARKEPEQSEAEKDVEEGVAEKKVDKGETEIEGDESEIDVNELEEFEIEVQRNEDAQSNCLNETSELSLGSKELIIPDKDGTYLIIKKKQQTNEPKPNPTIDEKETSKKTLSEIDKSQSTSSATNLPVYEEEDESDEEEESDQEVAFFNSLIPDIKKLRNDQKCDLMNTMRDKLLELLKR